MKNYHPHGWRKVVAIVLTFHFVCFTWLFFRNANFSGVGIMLKQIFTDFHAELIPQVLAGYKYVLFFMLFGYLSHFLPDRWQDSIIRLMGKSNVVIDAALITLIIYIVIQVKSSTIQPFIYFQF